MGSVLALTGRFFSTDYCRLGQAPEGLQKRTFGQFLMQNLLQAGNPSCQPTNSVKAPKNISVSVPDLMAIFPGEPGLASFIAAKDDGGGGDNWSYETCNAPVKLTPSVLQAGCPSCHPTNSVRAL